MKFATERCQFLVDNLDLIGATGVDDARWEHFQLAHLQSDSIFRCENKSRQIAWSWLSAAEAMADAILDGRDSIFVSINQEEAQEKIRYAKAVYGNLILDGLPKIQRSSMTNLELDNGARLSSLPARPPRGRARANIYLDEFAHVRDDKQIYTAALPVTSKGGRIRVASSPLGAAGVFWEVHSQTLRKYPGYSRKRTPWWHIQAFCLNVAEAVKLAPALTSAERVELFGNERIQAIFANMPLEDFQQEYEAIFVDESTAWISWAEISAAQDPDLICHMATAEGKILRHVRDAIARLVADVRESKVEQAFTAGVDIGRTRNTTEIFLIGSSTTDTYPLRLAVTLDGAEFDDQLDVVAQVLTELPVSKMLIDENGIGMNLAENAQKKFPSKVFPAGFTNATKRLWATDAKMLIQQRRTPLPPDRDIAYQIHSIKKMVTPSNNLIFDTERNEKHHADKFWAWALALAAREGYASIFL